VEARAIARECRAGAGNRNGTERSRVVTDL